MNIKIIYEDDDLLVINKPAGLLVHPTQNSKEETLVDWLVKKYPNIKNVGDPPTGSGQEANRPGIVHRLDKDTSGVLVIVKNQKSFDFLKKQFMERKMKKRYTALVYGNIKDKKGIIDLPIGKSKKDFRKKMAIGKIIGETREAITEYEVIKRFPDYTLVEVYPKTGRTHQIRVHFKSINHPIVCDRLYGFKKNICPFGLDRHFLHASSIEFATYGGVMVNFEADLPMDLKEVLLKLHSI